MKIAIIAPPFTTIPPIGHGGTERIIEEKITELIKRGHEVDIFGCGSFQTKANFRQIFAEPISEMKIDSDYVESSRPLRLETAYLTAVMEILSQEDGKYDVVFNHARGGYLLAPLFEKLKTPLISVFHLPLFEELNEALRLLKKANFISISNNQRKILPDVKFLATVYNGVDLAKFDFGESGDDYLVFIGALSKHKGVDLAIEATIESGKELKIIGGKAREPFFSREVKPKIDNKKIKLLGELDGEEKLSLLKNAKALILPIQWEEPFGLVMIEAMACGTPVIAFDRGAVSEIVKHGETGFIVPANDTNVLVEAINKVYDLSQNEYRLMRRKCREHVERNFTTEKMVEGYLAAYRNLAR